MTQTKRYRFNLAAFSLKGKLHIQKLFTLDMKNKGYWGELDKDFLSKIGVINDEMTINPELDNIAATSPALLIFSCLSSLEKPKLKFKPSLKLSPSSMYTEHPLLNKSFSIVGELR